MAYKNKKNLACLVCGADISRRQRGTKVCSDKCGYAWRRDYLHQYYIKHINKYREAQLAWRKRNPEKRRLTEATYQRRLRERYAQVRTQTQNQGEISHSQPDGGEAPNSNTRKGSFH